MFTTGLVLAAGRSARLGRAKQTLENRGGTLLGATLDMARTCRFDQLLVVIGGAADEVRANVDMRGCAVVENHDKGEGCSSSIATSLAAIDGRADGLVLLLGDQPEIDPSSVVELVAAAAGADAPLGVCRYADGRGHPFWFDRSLFEELDDLHGDKALWKLIECGRWPVTEVRVEGSIPLDVDTWDDYERLLESAT
jgi:molybdenum cofactor cytidylyltransferase